MFLHRGAYTMALNLGTKDQPIHIDFPSNELTHSQPPECSVAATSLSLPQRPLATQASIYPQGKLRKVSWGKLKPPLSPFVTPSLAAEPMITHGQGLDIICLKQMSLLNSRLLDVVQSLKRKRVDVDEESELAKKLKKSEKKRRKRERRAARVAQLKSPLHPHSIPFNVGFGSSRWSNDSLSRGPVANDGSLAFTLPQPRLSTPEPPLSMSSHGHQHQHETRHGEETLGWNGQHLFPSSNSYVAPSTSVPPSVPVHDPSSSSIHEDIPDNLSYQGALTISLFHSWVAVTFEPLTLL